MKNIKRISIIAVLFLTLLAIVSINFKNTTYAAMDELEELIMDGKKIKYFNKNKSVFVPKTYNENNAEMRGAWVATVWNIDMDKQNGKSEYAINDWKSRFLKILDVLERYNMNTIFFQIRPTNDAFYPSEYNDWSKSLVGAGIDPGWDPLAWMVEETHKRGMYFQCWLNAYRVTETSVLDSNKLASNYSNEELIKIKKDAVSSLSSKNFAKKHPEYVLLGESDTKLILNPGEPKVQEHIINTIKEIVENYPVDGLHFDDYFYLNSKSSGNYNSQTTNLNFAGGVTYNSQLTGENTLNDLGTYKRYLENPSEFNLEAGLTLGEFRRQSINNMMKGIREFIDEYNEQNNTYVEFGSKPAAVWQSNIENCTDTESGKATIGGSNTHCGAYSSNYDLFADSKHWVEAGYVDWVAPQVYYDFANREVPYADIVEWWVDVVSKTNEKRAQENKKPIKLYIAHGIYKADDTSTTQFKNTMELVYQMRFNTMFDTIKGSAVYAYNDLTNFTTDTQRQMIGANFFNLWNKNKVFPLPKGEDDSAGLVVGDVKAIKGTKNVRFIFDKLPNANMYALYSVNKGESLDLDSSLSRVNIIKNSEQVGNTITFTIGNYQEGKDYYIRAVSKNNHPSSEIVKIDTSKMITNTAPEAIDVVINDGNDTLIGGNPLKIMIPKAIDKEGDALTYTVELSTSGINGKYIYKIIDLEDNDTYYLANYETMNIAYNEVVVRVKVTDGEYTTTNYSNVIKIVEKKNVTKLDIPTNINVTKEDSDYVITFDEVGKALSYEIIIYVKGEEPLDPIFIENGDYIDYAFKGSTKGDITYIVQLRAVGNGDDILSSEFSEMVEIVIPKVTNQNTMTSCMGTKSMGLLISSTLLLALVFLKKKN